MPPDINSKKSVAQQLSSSARRTILSILTYVLNQAAILALFKISAVHLEVAENVSVIAIHSLGVFVTLLVDLGYSRPAYRYVAHENDPTRQASYYFRVNLQRLVILTVSIPFLFAYLTYRLNLNLGSQLFAILYIVVISLRSPWMMASDIHFSKTVLSELASGLLLLGFSLLIWEGDFLGEIKASTLIGAISVARLLPFLALATSLFVPQKDYRDLRRWDWQIWQESILYAGIRLVLLCSHYSNSIILLWFFSTTEMAGYVTSEKLFYAGLGLFSFAAQELVRAAAKGFFDRVPWWVAIVCTIFPMYIAILPVLIWAQQIVTIAFSDGYPTAASTLCIMVFAFPVYATNVVISNVYLLRQRHDRMIASAAVIGTIGNVGVLVAAIFLFKNPFYASFSILISEGSILIYYATILMYLSSVRVLPDN